MRYVLIVALLAVRVFGEDIYVGPANAGAADATSCANARISTWFNSAGNWGAGAGKISAGDTVHVCGTITGTAGQYALIAQGSGSAGLPVTILFETGAALTNSAYWGDHLGGAIDISNLSYVTVDGGTNGTIQNLANGTGLANNHSSAGVTVNGSNNIVVQNLTISNICQHTAVTDYAGCTTSGNTDSGIAVRASTSVTITNNTINDANTGIMFTSGTAVASTISNNTISRCNWGIAAYTTGGVLSGITISGNDISDAANWDTDLADSTFHHNGIYLYSTSPTSGIDGAVIANNYIHGTMSECAPNSCTTGWIFVADAGGSDLVENTQIFNNVLTNAGAVGPGNCYITQQGSATVVVNNTIYGNGVGIGLCGETDVRVQNNVVSGVTRFVSIDVSFAALTNNIYMDVAASGCSPWRLDGESCTAQSTFAAWQAATSGDASPSGYYATSSISSAGVPLAGSPTINAGVDLSALGITALNSDKAGVARGATWDIGAYEYAAPPPAHRLGNGRLRGGKIR